MSVPARPVPSPLRGRHRAALLALGVVSLFVACAAPKATSDKICTPRNVVFCRCRDRQEGQKLCKDDGRSFGPCNPCETGDNPEGPLYPGDPQPEDDDDGGADGATTKGSCGDGIVQVGEDCDDDNTNDTDGCDSSCKLAGKAPTKTNACPGLDVHVWGGDHAPTLASTTVGSGNRSVTPSCSTSANQTSGSTASDRVFKVTAHKTGSMKVATSDASYNVFLWVSGTCEPSANSYITCANASTDTGPETVTFPVENGKSYFVFVDGAGSGSESTRQGDFRVTFSIP